MSDKELRKQNNAKIAPILKMTDELTYLYDGGVSIGSLMNIGQHTGRSMYRTCQVLNPNPLVLARLDGAEDTRKMLDAMYDANDSNRKEISEELDIMLKGVN